ncbi:MAG: hypothetical protein ACREQ7_03510 [Candidatus Binatia bacterium]
MPVDTVKRWLPELRRAMIKVRPDFFSWSRQNRERYGANPPEKDRRRLDEALIKELFGARIRSWKRDVDGNKRIPLRELNRWNEAILPLVGIGEDCFYLNEWLGENKTILNFPTLRNYDEDDYRYQENARKRDYPCYASKPYRGSLYLSWARLFVDRKFTYATLSMAAGYLFSHLEDVATAVIETRVPHRYVPGKNHGKATEKSFQWDMRLAADGQEGMLEELQHQVFEYTRARYEVLLTDWDRANRRGVYWVDTSEPQERNVHFVFTNKDALSAVRLRSFVRDCRAIERETDELNGAVTEEESKLKTFIAQQHQELLQTFDPRIKRLRRRRKILIHKDAFDDLE